MKGKRFSTQLKEFLSGLGKNEKVTPTELIERLKNKGNGNGNGAVDAEVITVALKTSKFQREIARQVKRAPDGRVVLYVGKQGARKNKASVLTLTRYNALQNTIRVAAKGLRKYHEKRKSGIV